MGERENREVSSNEMRALFVKIVLVAVSVTHIQAIFGIRHIKST